MRGTDYGAGQVPSPAWRKLVTLGSLLVLTALLSRAAWGQEGHDRTVYYVHDISVDGLLTIRRDQVLDEMKTRPGKEYSALTFQDDIRRLAGKGWFKNVEVMSMKRVEGQDNQLSIHIHVQEHPNKVREIIYKNNHHAKPEDLDGVVKIHRGDPLNPAQNMIACKEIQEFYQKKDRLLCTVYLEEGGKPGDKRVVFNINEGPKLKIRQIHFTGNETLASGQRLKTQIDSKQPLIPGGGILFGSYNPAAVAHDQDKVRDYYRNNGYRDATVSREVILNDDMQTVDVIFHIDEGLCYRIQDVSLEGPKLLNRDLVRSYIRVKKDDVYNEDAIDLDVRIIKDLYGFRGYNVGVQKQLIYADKAKDPGLVRVQYQVIESTQHRAGEIKIIGNTVTKDRVIRRVLQIYPGQILSYPLLKQGENDLMRLGIFKADAETHPTIIVKDNPTDPASPLKDVEVHVQEQPTGSLMFGLGVNSNAGLMGSIVLNEKNFDILRPPTSLDDIFNGRAWRGGGQEFRIQAMPGTIWQSYTVSFREPFLFDRPISLSDSYYYNQRFYIEYNETRMGTRVSLGKQLNRFWNISGTVRAENVGVSGVLPWAPTDLLSAQGYHFIVGQRVSVARDDRDSFLRPTEGSHIEASFEEVLGSYTFPIASLEGERYFTTYQRKDGSGKHVLALRSQVAWAGSQAPIFERFYAGGFGSLRGFQFRGVGPNINGFMVGGDFMFLNTVEYQIPIKANDQLYVVAFMDHGTVNRDVSLANYRVTAGFGVRVKVPMMGPVPIAIDFGFPIVRAPSDRTQVIAFYVGMFK